MSQIPPELYRSIVENVSEERVLCALSLTSRDWNSEAERRLYEKITVDTIEPPMLKFDLTKHLDQRRVEKQEEMLLRLAQSPGLGHLLVHLDLHHLGTTEWVPYDVYKWTQFMPGMARICLNLKFLRLPDGRAQDFVPPTNAAFRLHTFEFKSASCHTFETAHAFREAVVTFLESQSDIRELIIPTWFDLETLPFHALPRLHTLRTGIINCSHLLPSRPVEKCELTYDMMGGFEEFSQVSLPHLKHLRIMLPRIKQLLWFTDSFSRLECLTVALCYWQDVDALKSAVYHMPNLSMLHVNTVGVYFGEEVNDENGDRMDRRTCLRRLNGLLLESRQSILTKCPSLKDSELTFNLHLEGN